MATQFDATARINLDLSGFQAGANQITRSGGIMEKSFENLHKVLGRVALVEKEVATEMSRSLRLYNQVSQAARNYSTAVASLAKNENQVAQGTKVMATAFDQLRASLSKVQGMSQREFERLQRTLTLYNQMATAVNTLARAQQAMVGVSQKTQQIEAQAAKERNRAAEAARKAALDEQKLAIARERSSTAARNAATAEARAQAQAIRAQAQLTEARRKDAAMAERQANATRQAARSLEDFNQTSFGLRSAIGDLESTYNSILNKIKSFGTFSIEAAISHEAAFAQIERVTQLAGNELEDMRLSFQRLAAELPTSFEETVRVGQLASQTGVANEQLIAFTDTVIRFSVTTGLASEQVTLLMSRIMEMRNIPAGDLNKLASTILSLGISSAATEDEILKLAESIATVTDIFGLTIPMTLGLASAFANLRVRPELSRGALTRVFAQLNSAVSSGGESMQTLQQIMGTTQENLTRLISVDPDTFFLKFIQGMSGTVKEGGLLRETLRDLGINAVRDIDVISRLANNYDLLADQVAKARVEFLIGNTLQEQSATIFETTRVELDNFKESITNLLAAGMKPLVVALGEIVAIGAQVIDFFLGLGPVVPIFGTVAAATGLAVAALLAYRVAVAATWRGVLAYTQAQNQLQGASFTLTGAIQHLMNVQANQARTATAAATANSASAVSTAATAAAMTRQAAAYGTVSQAQKASTAAASNMVNTNAALAMSASQVSAGMRNAAANTERMSGVYRDTATAAAINNAALTNQASLARSGSMSMMQLSNAYTVVGQNAKGAVGPMHNMSSQAQLTAQANAALATATNAASTANTANTTTMGVAGRAAGALSTSLSFLRANWLSLLGVAGLVGVAVYQLVQAFSDQTSAMKDAARAGTDAVGGMAAYQDALIADTKAVQEASVSFDEINEAIRESGSVATEAGAIYRTVAVSSDELTGSLRDRKDHELDLIRTQRRAIELAWGNADALKEQAQGQGAVAEAAREALTNLQALTEQEQAYAAALSGTTLAQGERVASLIQQQFQEGLVASGLLESASSFERLKIAMEASSFDVNDIVTGDTSAILHQLDELERALMGYDFQLVNEDVIGGIDEAEIALRNLGLSVQDINDLGGPEEFIASLQFLRESILENQQTLDEAYRSAAILTELGIDPLGDATQDTAEAMEAAAEAVEAYEAEISALADSYRALLNPTQAWADATEEAAETGISAITAFTREMQSQVEAQQSYARNMAVLASQGYGALVEQLQAMGPEGAAAAADLVNATEAELEALEVIALQAGDDYLNALAGSMDQLSRMGLGREAAASIGDSIVSELNRVTANGGSVQQASQRIIDILATIGNTDIAPEIVIDIISAQSGLLELESVIRSAQESGALDAEGEAILNTILYQNSIQDLRNQIAELEANHEVDAEGRALLDPEGYYTALSELRTSVAATVLEGLLDLEGDAALNPEQYEAALGLLDDLSTRTTENGDLDVRGNAYLGQDLFKQDLDELFRISTNATRNGDLNVQGTANLNYNNYERVQLPNAVQAAWNAGAQISQALNRTVTVGISYRANNSPPSAVRAATGGWINGPGGPTDDKVPAMLSNKEFVVNAKSAQKYAPLVEAINSDRLKTFSSSGIRPVTPTSRDLFGSRAPRNMTEQARVSSVGGGPVINVYNSYPQAEPTSVTVHRSLAYAATLSGV
ncbi:phage tail tape measure protein [Rhodococcus qingshengii]|uniref:phage tail tape measure protein n=1 Tax=Rhodococcus qingshengii TaxID=334542 RepID=UPI0035E12A5A